MPGLFIAVGQNGQRITSENGTDWINSQTGKEGETWRVITSGGGRFVAAGNFGGTNIFGMTSDGAAWEFSRHEGNYSRFVRGIIFHNGQFVALGGDPGSVGVAKPFALISSDGKTWSNLIELPGKHILRRFAVGNGLITGSQFAAVGAGATFFSTDGFAWQRTPNQDAPLTVAYGSGAYVGLNWKGRILHSTDALAWREVFKCANNLESVAFGNV
jgi:hypothetical protein